MDPVTPETPTPEVPVVETPTTPEEVKPTTDWLPEKVDDNKEEVKATEQDTPKTDDEDAKDLLEFLQSLSGDTPEEKKEGEKEDTDKDNKDPFFNPNSEPEIFKKQIESVTLERDELKWKVEEFEKSKEVLTLIETDPALKSFIQLVQKWTPAAKVFSDYLASKLPPAPDTTATAKGAKAQEGNTPADLVRRVQAMRQTRTKPV
jgi:hypothetical protein